MNFDSLRSHGHSDVPLQPEWQLQIEAWRDLLAQCARKPSRRRVHALRSLTLRLRVALEYRLEQAQDATAARAFKRWNKEGKMLRRALEPVRDADVYLARLDGLRDSLEGAPDGRPKLSPRCLREMDKLEGRLEQRRQTGIDELMAVIDARGKRLRRLSKEMEVALAPRMSSRVLSTRQEALRIFGELAREFPNLDSSNLHTYRKRLKQALYLAEISATADPLAGKLAAALRKIHAASGEWHDWQALALEAGRTLHVQSKQDSLVAVLETQAEGALERVLPLCRRSAERLLKNAGEIQPSQRRKPVAADPGYNPCDEDLAVGISS
ncbi:MAG: CHAD domain-containing protein [Terracidiphilus sp.]|jgi:hypothetical protein